MTTSPEHQNGHTVCTLAAAFLSAGDQVALFLMDDGVYHIVKKHKLGISEKLKNLLAGQMTVSVCSQSLEKRGVSEESCIAGVDWASQHELARILAGSDRFLSFGA